MLPTYYGSRDPRHDDLPTVGGGPIDAASREAGPGYALLATDRGVCGLVRWDDERGVAYDDGVEA